MTRIKRSSLRSTTLMEGIRYLTLADSVPVPADRCLRWNQFAPGSVLLSGTLTF